MNGNQKFAVAIVAFVIVMCLIFSCTTSKDSDVANPEESSSEVILETDSTESYLPGSIHFDLSNAKPYWVARWNSPAFFSNDGYYDGCAYDGEFIMGTRIDSLVYYIERYSGLEKYFYANDLSLDPRATAWWQQSVTHINDTKFATDLYTAVRECLCIREDFSNGHLATLYFVNDIKGLGLLETEKPTLDDIRVVLLRYTRMYYGENLSKQDAENILRKWDRHT